VASDSVRIAKINTVQAVVVAIIAAAGGVLGTFGVKYAGDRATMRERNAEIAELHRQAEALKRQLRDLRYDADRAPLTVLLTGNTSHTPEECLDRISNFRQSLPKELGDGAGDSRTTYDGNVSFNFGSINVRAACDPVRKLLVVAVSAGGGRSMSVPDPADITVKIKTLLER
jgi:hypothetical protein